MAQAKSTPARAAVTSCPEIIVPSAHHAPANSSVRNVLVASTTVETVMSSGWIATAHAAIRAGRRPYIDFVSKKIGMTSKDPNPAEISRPTFGGEIHSRNTPSPTAMSVG